MILIYLLLINLNNNNLPNNTILLKIINLDSDININCLNKNYFLLGNAKLLYLKEYHKY